MLWIWTMYQKFCGMYYDTEALILFGQLMLLVRFILRDLIDDNNSAIFTKIKYVGVLAVQN